MPVAVVPVRQYIVAETVTWRPGSGERSTLLGEDVGSGAASGGRRNRFGRRCGDLLRALLRVGGAAEQRLDLARVQVLLLLERREIRRALIGGAGYPRPRLLGLADEQAQLLLPAGKLAQRDAQLAAGSLHLLDDARIVVGDAIDAVDRVDDAVERRCAEDDCERIRVALDVEGPDAVGERVLRLGFRLARETDLAARRCLAALELVDSRSQGCDAALGIAQLALERVQLEEGARRLVVELRVLGAKPIGLRPKRVRIVRAGGAGDQRQAG